MSRRLKSPDTEADEQLKACIRANPPQPFVVRAGAGSGKTTSLIKALDCVMEAHGHVMRQKKQQAACITYTELAANEIRADVNDSPLVHVSTIHSFYWTIAKTFQNDIRAWLARDIHSKIDELVEKAQNFGPKVRATTRENNLKDQQRYASHLAALGKVKTFSYGVGSDYPKGILGHEDILNLADFLLQEKPLFRRVVALRFPFVFVDESQDTFESVVRSFKLVEQQMRRQFCLGFFGDPMQRIFMRGVGDISLEENWKAITKPENFRSATSILKVANAIRAKGDGLVQVRGLHERINDTDTPVSGTARMFVLPNTMQRQEALAQVRAWSSKVDGDEGWTTPELAVKILVIVHRMAANRLGFGGIFAALNDRAPESIKQGMLDGTGWPLRPFLDFVLPLVTAMNAKDEFEAMNILRAKCPRFQPEALSRSGAAQALKTTRDAVLKLVDMLASPTATIRDVANLLRGEKLFAFEERFDRALGLTVDQAAAEEAEDSGSDGPMLAFLACRAQQLWPYQKYVLDESPFATQHGVKGAQFDRVLVVLDEEESNYSLYNYEKFFGITPLTDEEKGKLATGEDTGWTRTLRLLYVTCTRAKRALALVFFVKDPDLAVEKVLESGILSEGQVLKRAVLDAT